MVEQAPKPHSARRTVLLLDDAIEDSPDVARVAQVAGNAPCIQTDRDGHQVLYSSGMALQNQPPHLSHLEFTHHALHPNDAEIGAHAKQMRHEVSSMQSATEHQVTRCRLYNEAGTFQQNRLPVITSDSYCRDASSFETCFLVPPSLHGLDGVPLVLPSGGYAEAAPVSQRLDTHSTMSQPAASQHVPFTIPGNSHGSPTSGPPSGPAPGSLELPSVGSGGHAAGRCKPCAFIYNKGCGNGIECEFCHLCPPGEKKRRHKEKLANRPQLK